MFAPSCTSNATNPAWDCHPVGTKAAIKNETEFQGGKGHKVASEDKNRVCKIYLKKIEIFHCLKRVKV